jgi:hypothetical protein
MSESQQPPAKTPLLSDRMYTWLKYTAAIVLPAAGALYFALAQIWNFPRAEEVTGSIVAFNAFLGVVFGLGVRSYNNSDVTFDGTIKLSGGKMASVEIHHDSESSVVNKGVGLFKIEG